MMSIQCSACGYVTNDTRDKNCVRCDAPLDIPAEALQPAVLAPPIAAPPPRFEAPPLPPPRKRSGSGRTVLAVGLLLLLAALGVLGLFYFNVVKPQENRRPSQASLKQLLTNQPDFYGDADFVEGDRTFNGRMARFGDQFMMEVHFPRALLLNDPSRSGKTPINVLFKPGKPITILIPEVQAYAEVKPGTYGLPKDDPLSQVFAIVRDEKCEVEEYGPSTIGDYKVIRYRLNDLDGNRSAAFVSLAPSLRNAIVEVDVGPDWTAFKGRLKYTMKNVALESKSDLFRVPSTYTQVK